MGDRLERREFCKTMAAFPLLTIQASGGKETEHVQIAPGKAQFVAAGQDRAGTPVAMGFSSLGFKVSGQDTHGELFLMEHVGLAKGGGPPRHLHYEQ